MNLNIFEKFSQSIPFLMVSMDEYVKLEVKPYLQPFEYELAIRELNSLLQDCVLKEEQGYYIVPVSNDLSADFLKERLTFWQRVGISNLELTKQLKFELTQNGKEDLEKRLDLHKARRLRYGPHDIHEYRGKFFPQLVRSLINISGIKPGSLMLDPMCGSGTTPCEATVLGMNVIGVDINPLSFLIANVKSHIPLCKSDTFQSTLIEFVQNFNILTVKPEEFWDTHDLKYLRLWFAEDALIDIASIISFIEMYSCTEFYKKFLLTCLSNIIRSVSWQKESDLRVRKEIKEYVPGYAQKAFIAEVKKQLEKIVPYLELVDNEIDVKIDLRKGDSSKIDSIFEDYLGKVDLLITSPPYATALPYLDTDRLSLVALKLLSRKSHSAEEKLMIGTREISEKERCVLWEVYLSRKEELPAEVSTFIDYVATINHKEGIGFRRKNLPSLLGKYFLSMLDAMKAAHRLMKPGAKAYYVVGNNSTELDGIKTEIPTDDFLFLLGEKAGWKPIEKLSMELLSSRDIFKKNRGSSETILSFEA